MIEYKSAAEIDKMRYSGKITSLILKEMSSMVKIGVTPLELDTFAEKRCSELGVTPSFKNYGGFPNCVCISVNEQIVHGIPGKRPFKYGDLVKLDFGVIANKYHGDSAVTIAVGNILPIHQKLLDTTKLALDLAIIAAKPGNKLGDISYAIQLVIENAGFYVPPKFCGHGIGRHLHMEPSCPNFGNAGTGIILKEGLTLAIEPIANIGTPNSITLGDKWTEVTADNSYSAHFEHTIVINATGCEILTM